MNDSSNACIPYAMLCSQMTLLVKIAGSPAPQKVQKSNARQDFFHAIRGCWEAPRIGGVERNKLQNCRLAIISFPRKKLQARSATSDIIMMMRRCMGQDHSRSLTSFARHKYQAAGRP